MVLQLSLGCRFPSGTVPLTGVIVLYTVFSYFSFQLSAYAHQCGAPTCDRGKITDLENASFSIALAPWEAPQGALNDYKFLRGRVMEEHGWELARAEGAITEYLRFMQLLADARRMELVASMDVDLVWHEHILDTSNYASDCFRLWGRFLHHRRARSPEELSEIPGGYTFTKQNYFKRYGIVPPRAFWGGAVATSMCGGDSADLLNTGPVTAATTLSPTSPTTTSTLSGPSGSPGDFVGATSTACSGCGRRRGTTTTSLSATTATTASHDATTAVEVGATRPTHYACTFELVFLMWLSVAYSAL